MLAGLLLLAPAIYAQNGTATERTLHGTVLDAGTAEPLPGASIRVFIASGDSLIRTSYGAVARTDGSFRLSMPIPGTVVLEASSVGYDNTTIVVTEGMDTVEIGLAQKDAQNAPVEVIAIRRTRTVEDACCRVESIREEVQQHAPFSPGVVDVLSRYSSCTSSRISCGIDNSSSIRLRGLEPTAINVLLDGLPAFTGLSTFYGLSLVPSHALQTIRISEGASSALYGNGALSGVIDLETRPPTEIPEFSVSGNIAGHGLERPEQGDLNLSYTGMVGDIGIAAFGSLNMHEPAGEIGGINRAYRRASAVIKGNMMLDATTELILSTLVGQEKRTGAHMHAETHRPEHREQIEMTRGDISAKLARTLGERSEISTAGMISLQHLNATYGVNPIDAQQQTAYMNVKYSQALGDHLLLVGGEMFSDRLKEQSGPGIGYDLSIPSLFVQDEIALTDKWTLLASLRADHHSSAGTAITPRGSIRYAPLSTLRMRLMAGNGFKGEALFNEEHLTLHGAYRWHNNRDLQFERSFTLNYDISYSFIIGDEAGIDANFNAYYTTISGKAIPQSDSLAAGTLFFVNSSQPARLTGVEVQVRPTYGEHWSSALGLALIRYTLRDARGVYQQMPLAPRMNLDASLMYRNEGNGVTVEAWGSYIGSQQLPANPYGIQNSSGYTLLHLRAEKALGTLAIFAGVSNLLNARQSSTMPLTFEMGGTENSGIIWGPIEGREVFLGARFTWRGAEG